MVPAGFAERPVRGRRYLLLVVVEPGGERAPAGGDRAEDDGPEAWVREMDGRGVRLFGEVLRGPADATFVRRRHDEVLVTDGGFAEAKEWVAGFDLIEVQGGLAEAIEVASKHPMARGGAIELRPLWPFDVHEDHVARTEREAADLGRRLEPAAAVAAAGSER
ncbi:transcription initiation protein [Agromyces sp. Q22]|uniref:Transcription initiation protein n=1 Tax=Agromyces kandeliae TaxID=2666141 RepID=A0A6L5QZE2_9MICO|nr:transcription initiation protein [Agromyces kandeliae]